jgi:hypothetical protein
MKRLLGMLILSASSLMTYAQQDTVWVQTFTFDTIVTRRANFTFPQELDTMRFEKVLMYYKLKCSPLTTWDQYNCGEWDYLTYARVFEHTGVFDSVRVDGPHYKINSLSPLTYSYAQNPYFDQRWSSVSRRNPVATTNNPIAGTATTPIEFVRNGAHGGRLQWVVTQSELAGAGISMAGDLQGLTLNFLNSVSALQGVQIRVKHTTNSTLTGFETSGFTTVYSDQWMNLANGQQALHFSTPFAYDGSSNLIIELVYEDARPGLNSTTVSALTTSGNTLGYFNRNGVFTSNGSNYASINMNNVDLGGDVTIAFWAKGNGSYSTNTSILEMVDSLNQRIFNIHMPWSDNTIYFDAGEGPGFDRISKAATINDIEAWHHWAFVKKTSTGQMFIYRDGVLWHSGTGLTRPIGKVDKFILGSNWNQGFMYKGSIDEFTVWTEAIDAATLLAWKDKQIETSHPYYADLALYYDFDGELAMIDRSAHDRMGMCSDVNMIESVAYPIAGTTSTASIPEVGFIQGTYSGTVVDSVLSAVFAPMDVVFEYAASDNAFHIVNTMATYPTGTIDTLAANGSVISSTAVTPLLQLNNDTITFYYPPFEIVNDIEIGRYITPYGIGFDLGPNGFTWIYDVTDYQKYLHGVVDLAAHNTQELIDLKFAFIEGIPARDVHDVKPIWNNFRSYNYGEMDNDVVLQEVAVPLSDTSDMFKIKTRFTGHGHNGSVNCCEWDSKDHQILVNGVPRFTWEIWEENACGENPNISQGGTWPYAREGWCPGDMVKEYDHDLTPYVQPGDTVLLDYDIEDVPANDQAQAGGNYVVAMDLVSYSSPNFQHDAAIVDILNPNSYEYYSKWNPTCSNPRVILQNNGAQPLTKCNIRIWVTYGSFVEYEWTGNLAFLEKEIVEVPINDQAFWWGANPDERFHAQVWAVGGYPDLDEYAANNYRNVAYKPVEYINGPFFVWFQTNNKANENSWKLQDAAGNIIFQRNTLINNTDYKDTFDLAPGCYSITVEDIDHDGISFWAAQQYEGETSGYFRIRKVGGSIMEAFPGDFGKYHRYDFSVGFALDVQEHAASEEFVVFPNPGNDKIRVEFIGQLGNEISLDIVDMNGRVVSHSSLEQQNGTYAMDLNITDLQKGYYLVRLTGNGGTRVTPFVKQ